MASLSTRDIDCVAYYEDPQVKLNRVNSVNIHYSKNSYLSNYFKLKNWITKKLAIEKVIYDELPSFNGSIFFLTIIKVMPHQLFFLHLSKNLQLWLLMG